MNCCIGSKLVAKKVKIICPFRSNDELSEIKLQKVRVILPEKAPEKEHSNISEKLIPEYN